MWDHRIRELLFIPFVVLIFAVIVPQISGEEGGSDERIEIFGEAGGTLSWNQVYNFSITEEGNISEEKLNVTLCENVSFQDEKWVPTGHIFGSLDGIFWDDDPEPSMTITQEDFFEFSEDNDTLTLFLHGEYTHPTEGDRHAYKEITIQRPNTSPVAVTWFAVDGVWDWHNLSEEIDVTVIIEDGDNVTLWFNASNSWDSDGEEVTDWYWIFSDEFGSSRCPVENVMNISACFYLGKSYDLALSVGDARGKRSDTLEFTIHIVRPELKPDLVLNRIEYVNKNMNKWNFEVGDHIIIQPIIKNIGENDTTETFKVRFEYSVDGSEYIEMAVMVITQPIASGNIKILTYTWDTSGYPVGQYRITATADFEDVVNETLEDNNVNRTNIFMLEKVSPCCPILEIRNVTSEKHQALVNEMVEITVTLRNIGASDALYVDVRFLVNGAYEDLVTYDTILQSEETTAYFNFTRDVEGTFDVTIELIDDGQRIQEAGPFSISVEKIRIPTARIQSISPNPAEKDQSIGFVGKGMDEGEITGYHWRSSKDGDLSSEPHFIISNLSVGSHTIFFRVRNDQGQWSSEVEASLVIKEEKEDDGASTIFLMLSILTGVAIATIIIIERKNNRQ